jgi:hypothetical protein
VSATFIVIALHIVITTEHIDSTTFVDIELLIYILTCNVEHGNIVHIDIIMTAHAITNLICLPLGGVKSIVLIFSKKMRILWYDPGIGPLDL